MDNVIIEITDAICEIADGNEFIDFEEFLDILQEIEIDTEQNNNYNKTNLKKYFCDLLVILRCDLDELSITKFNNYVMSNYNSFLDYVKLQHKKTHKKMKLSAINYMKYLINLHLNSNNNKSKPKNNKTKNKNKHRKSGPISTEILLLIGSEMTEYLDDSESMDYQDFIGCCREFIGDKYPEQNIKIVYEFISKQQLLQNNNDIHIDIDHIDTDTEITVSFFIRTIAKYGDKCDDVNDIIKSVFDKISFNQLQIRHSEIIKNLRSYLENKDSKQCGMITLEEFISGLKSANVTSISSRDMKKIFNLSTTNGRMKINLFMDRFIDSLTYAYDIDQLILNAFDGIIKKKKHKKKKKKKKFKKKVQQQQITINDDILDSDILDLNLDILDINDEKDGFEKLQIAFTSIDENHDNQINFKEFMAVIIADLKMNLKENECKSIYYHQALQRDYCLDLNDFFDQIHEEFLSFPDATCVELLHRYFAKILQEAAPFEKLNEFILDYLIPQENNNISNLQCEIIALYGSMSTNPLLRRIYRQQTFDYTNKYLHFLQKNVTPRVLGAVIRSIRRDSSLKDAEITKMYNEWLICLNRINNHKFNDLYELDFLLFHLGLIVSQKLVKRVSNTFLNTVFESEPVSPRNSKSPNALRLDTENNNHSIPIPSFMKSTKETLNLQLLNSDLNKINKIKKINNNKTETDSYHSTKKQYANQIIASQSSNVKFKLIDLIGEFIDENDNTISIREQYPYHTPPSPSTSVSSHEKMKILHRRARSELLLSKISNKSILQRRKERIAKQKKKKKKKNTKKPIFTVSSSLSLIDRKSIPKFKIEQKCAENNENNENNNESDDDRGRSRSFNLLDIDLVSNHRLSENRFWARTLSLDDGYDHDNDDEDGLLTESVTPTTPVTDDEGEDDFDEDYKFCLIDEEEDDDELKENDIDDEKYNIIGQEKVSFDPLTSTAIYDPMRNILVWSNGTKWIKKDFKIFCGKWRDPRGCVIMIDENGLIHYIAPKLGTFQCRIVGFYKVAIQFQANVYQAQLIDINNLKWENGTIWKRVGDQIMYFVM